jgi:putative Holliday junction resolvase
MTQVAGPILAVDLGVRRTGLARSDPERVLASGLDTFTHGPGRSLHRRIAALHAESALGGIVIGIPRRADGRAGGPRAEILALGEWVRRALGLPVAYWDEAGSSAEAAARLREAPRKVRRDRARIDQMAARLILQEFLDAGCPFAEHGVPEPGDDATDA